MSIGNAPFSVAAGRVPRRGGLRTNHFAWETAPFDLQVMYRYLKIKEVEILRTRENAHSVGVYLHDSDGNGLEVYLRRTRGVSTVTGRPVCEEV